MTCEFDTQEKSTAKITPREDCEICMGTGHAVVHDELIHCTCVIEQIPFSGCDFEIDTNTDADIFQGIL